MMTTGQPTGCTSASRLGVYPTVHEPIQGIVVKFYFQISFCMLSVINNNNCRPIIDTNKQNYKMMDFVDIYVLFKYLRAVEIVLFLII